MPFFASPPGEVEIAENQIDRVFSAERDGCGGLLGILNRSERKAGLDQHHLQQSAKVRVVVDDQDVLACRAGNGLPTQKSDIRRAFVGFASGNK